MTMIIRNGTVEDVEQMSTFLRELTAAGKRLSPDDEEFVRQYYIESVDKIRCSVAEDDGIILGFQSLKTARAGNQWGVEPGWGIVGTHIRPSAARRGVGRALFDVTRRAAQDAGLAHIDASIGANNPEGLAYYEAMGFRTYRTPRNLICKRFDILQ
ncbi:GNAT family N-acetyltransferase [uncultured Tateyamaria sp.]|uniref:GNAT family N-acetyltransferase n=1 Tax=uncultured Tateyamaria sp. TaxID=455651 RepID=UPI00260E657A|nr:GNAT family N-acetyltransferase [uncultured Tateyamaria sp.]